MTLLKQSHIQKGDTTSITIGSLTSSSALNMLNYKSSTMGEKNPSFKESSASEIQVLTLGDCEKGSNESVKHDSRSTVSLDETTKSIDEEANCPSKDEAVVGQPASDITENDDQNSEDVHEEGVEEDRSESSTEQSLQISTNDTSESSRQLPPYEPMLQPPEHLKDYLSTDHYNCAECGDKFILQSSLSKHTERRSILITYPCKECCKDLVFYNQCTLEAHLRQHPNPEGAKYSSNPLPRDRIDLSPHDVAFGGGSDLVKSIMASYPPVHNRNKTSCYDCKSSFLGIDTFLEHFLAEANQDSYLWRCDICQLVLPNRCNMLAHKRYHKQMKPFICPDCGEIFKVWGAFILHLQSKCFHPFKRMRYKCTKCNSVFQETINLSIHILDNHMKTLFKCSACPVACYTTQMLDIHKLKAHKNPLIATIPFQQCQVCPSGLISKNKVAGHVYAHSQSRAGHLYIYYCDECSAVFINKQELGAHKKKCHKDSNEHNISLACKVPEVSDAVTLKHNLQNVSLSNPQLIECAVNVMQNKSIADMKKVILKQVDVPITKILPKPKQVYLCVSGVSGTPLSLVPVQSLTSAKIVQGHATNSPIAKTQPTGTNSLVGKVNELSKDSSVAKVDAPIKTYGTPKRKIEDGPLPDAKQMKTNNEHENLDKSTNSVQNLLLEKEKPVEENKVIRDTKPSTNNRENTMMEDCMSSDKKVNTVKEDSIPLVGDKENKVISNSKSSVNKAIENPVTVTNDKGYTVVEASTGDNKENKRIEDIVTVTNDKGYTVEEDCSSLGDSEENEMVDDSLSIGNDKGYTIEEDFTSLVDSEENEMVDDSVPFANDKVYSVLEECTSLVDNKGCNVIDDPVPLTNDKRDSLIENSISLVEDKENKIVEDSVPLSSDKGCKVIEDCTSVVANNGCKLTENSKPSADKENRMANDFVTLTTDKGDMLIKYLSSPVDERENKLAGNSVSASEKKNKLIEDCQPSANGKKYNIEENCMPSMNDKENKVKDCGFSGNDMENKLAEDMSSTSDSENKMEINCTLSASEKEYKISEESVAVDEKSNVEDCMPLTNDIDIKTEVVDLCFRCGEPISDAVNLESHECFPSISPNSATKDEALSPPQDLIDSYEVKSEKVSPDTSFEEKIHGQMSDGHVVRVSLDVSQTESLKFTWYRCHLCNVKLVLDWSILKKHYSEEHKNVKVLDLSPKVEKLKVCVGKKKGTVSSFSKPIAGVASDQYMPAPRKKRKKQLSPFKSGIMVTGSIPASNFECSKCSFTSNIKTKFESHIKSHRIDSTSFQCSVCGLCFVVQPSLVKHLFVSHRIKDPSPYLETVNKDDDAMADDNSA